MKTLHLSIFTMMGICLFMLGLMPILPAQATQYTFSSSFGTIGHGAGQFSYPTGIAINSTGFVYVADSGNSRIQIFDSAGHWKKSFGTQGNITGQFDGIYGIALNSTGFIFVADTGNYRIQIFDPSGNWKQTIGGNGPGKSRCFMEGCFPGGYGSANGQFNGPEGIVINSAGFIFVVDSGNDRIQIFDPSGNWKKSFGTFGHGTGQLSSPDGIALNSTGFIFVADTSNNRIQIFDPSGNWKQTIGGDGPGKMGFGGSGSANSQFSLPEGIAINSTDAIFVTDQYNNRIQIFDSSGNWKQTIGGDNPHLDSSPGYCGSGSANSQFCFPDGIALNSTGFIFVTEQYDNRIQIFNPVQIVPEFLFAIPILVISFVSVIVFYRIKIIN